nr:hypothetical protein [Tanacetum cinerariifolium]GEY48265.1 hypothetical protein [Tanacetum cinerariifolium]GEY50967.1 hypothetical protein [Tanacetum cinerariifolium]
MTYAFELYVVVSVGPNVSGGHMKAVGSWKNRRKLESPLNKESKITLPKNVETFRRCSGINTKNTGIHNELKDKIAPCLQEEIADETDVCINIHKRIRIPAELDVSFAACAPSTRRLTVRRPRATQLVFLPNLRSASQNIQAQYQHCLYLLAVPVAIKPNIRLLS